MQPTISVIIPVYNSASHLGQALDTVLAQGISPMEIIYVDDGSTDDSLQILQQYASKNACIQVLTQQNQYAGVARNNGLQGATGEYVAFWDAECLLGIKDC